MPTRLRWRQSCPKHSLQPLPTQDEVPSNPMYTRSDTLHKRSGALLNGGPNPSRGLPQQQPWNVCLTRGVLPMECLWAGIQRTKGALVSTTTYLLCPIRPMMQHPTPVLKSLVATPPHCIPCMRTLYHTGPVPSHLNSLRLHMHAFPPTRKMS